MSNPAFRDPGNLRHQVGLVLAQITDALAQKRSVDALVLMLDSLCWTYMRERPELVEMLEKVQEDYRAGQIDALRYRMEEVRVYVHCLRLCGVIDKQPLSVSDATDYLQGEDEA